MAKCFNPDCLNQNPNNDNFCQKCGQKLLLTERYRALNYLGEGGFGRTFIGMDQARRNSLCVIKQFLPLQQGSGTLQKCIQLFEQEAELLEKLGKHSQIPDLLAFFEQDSKLYLIQEFVEGEDLLKELQRKGRFTEDEVKTFLIEMLPVLDFIHNKNVIHRDIKPENILRRKIPLDPSIYGQISDLVLIDFGVSKQVSASVMTKMGTGVGTIGYTAPEQNRGIAKPASDLYSLAVTAIRLLTGVLPEERNGSMIDDIFDIDDFSWKWKEWLIKNGLSVNNNLANILDKMLADKISDRFKRAREVLEVLQIPISSPQPQTPKVSYSPSQPQPTIKLTTSKANFTQLDQLLAQGKWKEADQETTQLMFKIMSSEKEGYLTVENCRNFPPEYLRIIDQLWLKYSQGRFGFSVQKQIWLKYSGRLDGSYQSDIYEKLAKEVSWLKTIKKKTWLGLGEKEETTIKSYSELTFNTNAPLGHLPFSHQLRYSVNGHWYSHLLSKL
jgi:serine/threonine protein kinase